MSYDKIIEYKIIPTETFKITRGCAGCGCKQTFSCKDNFRVNANGNRLDVWLIYGCERCGHTYNLPVFERISASKINEEDYSKFLSNDKKKVFEIGTNKSIFIKNRAEIAWDQAAYEIVLVTLSENDLPREDVLVKIYNPYDIPVRKEKVLAGIFEITRSEVKRLINSGCIEVSLERKKL